MIKVTLLALDNALASSIMGSMDVFSLTGSTWNYIASKQKISYFDLKVVTKDGMPSKSKNNAAIIPNCSIHDIESTDVIIISSISDFSTLLTSDETIEWLHHHFKRGTTIASVCSGTFVLAKTGLLNGKQATVHWGFAAEFKRRYPEVHLRPDKIITEEEQLLCSGGYNSYIALSFYIVEKFCGRDVAIESSKAMLHDLGRSSQDPYSISIITHRSLDPEIHRIQEWLEKNFNHRIDMQDLADAFGMSRRVLERRFKTATGMPPLLYLQQIRVEIAKKYLESTSITFSEIAVLVGYEDTSFFRKIFQKQTKTLPKEYRAKFYRNY
jgi:transcriptional regulator GlxA family with amidase domain